MEIFINESSKSGAKREKSRSQSFWRCRAILQNFSAINVGERELTICQGLSESRKNKGYRRRFRIFYLDKVYFFPRSGKVMVKKLRQLHNNTIVNREMDYANRLSIRPTSGDIELFG